MDAFPLYLPRESRSAGGGGTFPSIFHSPVHVWGFHLHPDCFCWLFHHNSVWTLEWLVPSLQHFHGGLKGGSPCPHTGRLSCPPFYLRRSRLAPVHLTTFPPIRPQRGALLVPCPRGFPPGFHWTPPSLSKGQALPFCKGKSLGSNPVSRPTVRFKRP
eukprot:scaffold155_cov347-Pavlova_lutheri.AAC.41